MPAEEFNAFLLAVFASCRTAIEPNAGLYVCHASSVTINTGDRPMKLLAVYSPPGPEALLRSLPGCRIEPPIVLTTAAHRSAITVPSNSTVWDVGPRRERRLRLSNYDCVWTSRQLKWSYADRGSDGSTFAGGLPGLRVHSVGPAAESRALRGGANGPLSERSVGCPHRSEGAEWI